MVRRQFSGVQFSSGTIVLESPRWIPRLINFLKLLPRSQIMSPRPIKEYVFYPGHKEALSLVIFEKIGGPH